MIQVALCEQALIKENRKPIQNHQSKTMLLSKRTYRDLSLTDISSTSLANAEWLPVFLVGEFGTSEILMQK